MSPLSPDDLNQRLSTHFTLREALKSNVAMRHGIDNTPPRELIPAMVRVAEHILEPVRVQFRTPIVPSSFYRCPALNTAVGSANPNSQHTKGEAVDFEIAGFTNYEIAKWISENLDFDQLILECYVPGDPSSGWVHVSCASISENRREILHYNGKFYAPGLS
ncbi:D-Ala-D-Ala carboxypeptidase family metallohydrolase [Thalassospira lucentensis]|uniref:D-Ala-D-Ala carboxypeptidase family metallohydrolase n=1 Tax=Thalassospira lucentensis TaxID=168935 RepID=UPI003AA83D9A